MGWETDNQTLPGIWWSFMWGSTAYIATDYTPITQWWDELSFTQNYIQDLWLHRCSRGKDAPIHRTFYYTDVTEVSSPPPLIIDPLVHNRFNFHFICVNKKVYKVE